MEAVKFELTHQEIDDLRQALIAKFLDLPDGEAEKSKRLGALMTKLARISVLGHA